MVPPHVHTHVYVFTLTLIVRFILGVLITLFFQCMAALLNPTHRREEGIKWWLIFHTVAMFSFVTVYTAMNLHIQSNSFIDNRKDKPDYISGPLSYIVDVRTTALGLVPNIMFNLNNWLADGLLVSSLFDTTLTCPDFQRLSTPRSTDATSSTPRTSGLSPFPASCTLPLWVRTPPFYKSAAMLRTNSVNVGTGIATLYFQYNSYIFITVPGLPKFGIPYLSISVSLNVLLTLMIVIRLVLHGRIIRNAAGSLAGISGLYKTISTMLIESCALFSVSSLFVVGALTAVVYGRTLNALAIGGFVVDIFFPILAEIQVRTFPRRPSLRQLPYVTMDWTGDCSIAHHSTGCQRERGDEAHYHNWTHQFVQR